MNNLKRLKNFNILLLLVMFISIIAGNSVVNAYASVSFTSWQEGTNPLWTSTEYYCAEHHDNFGGGTWIEDNNSWTITSENEPESYRILAHILKDGEKQGKGGYNARGPHQRALWHWLALYGLPYSNDHFSRSGTLKNFSDPGENQLYRDAAGAAKNKIPYSNGSAKLVLTDSKLTMVGLVGALNIKEKSGDLENVEVTWKDPTDGKEYKKRIDVGKSKEDGWIEFYSDKECKKPININDFNVGTVYIKNLKENYFLKHIDFHVTSKASGFSVTVKRWVKSNGSTSQQDLLSADLHEGDSTPANIPLDVEYAFGDLRIEKEGVYKKDGTAVKQKNVVADFKIYCPTLKKWVAGSANGDKTYVDSIDKATTYKSSTTINRLFASYQYQLVEVAVHNRYYNNPIKMIAVTSSDKNEQLKVVKVENDKYYASSSVVVSANKTKTVTVLDERTSGDLIIIKADDTYKDLILKAKFKVYSKENKGWLIKNSDGSYKYAGDAKSATEFESEPNDKGKLEVKIECIKLGTYYVYETTAPEGYDLTKQDGYENRNGKDPYSFSKDNKWAYLGEANLDTSNNIVEYTYTNKKIVAKLKGRVWIDKPDTKKYDYDNVYKENSQDEVFTENMPVYLYDGETLIAETKTDKDGCYEFTRKNAEEFKDLKDNDRRVFLNYWDFARYHVEFAYDNIKYIVVDPFVGKDVKINSKAMEEAMTQKNNKDELKDEDLTGINGDMPGRAITYKDGSNYKYEDIFNNNYRSVKETPLTGYYNGKTYEIEDINFGIKEKHDPGYSINQELDYVRVEMNGYTYTYKEEGKQIVSPYVPAVALQDSVPGANYDATYTAAIYPTDIAYNKVNGIGDNNETDKGLKVYVVYSINIENSEKKPEDEYDDIYAERTLYLKSLENKFDPERYMLSSDHSNEDGDFARWTAKTKTDENNQTITYADYNLDDKDNTYAKGVGPESKKTSHIQFRITEKALEDMLENRKDQQNLEKVPTVVTSTAYHEYQRTDNVWNEKSSAKKFNGAKGEYVSKNKSGETYYTHKSVDKNATSANLYINLILSDSRKLSGTVFEDNKVNELNEEDRSNEKLGNGKIDKDENRASNVKVELLDASSKDIATLYQVVDPSEDNNIVKTPQGVTYTDKEGNYTLNGVVPGKYYIRFTYGDGQQVMLDQNGNKIKDRPDIYSNDYRSTIITNKNIEDALESSEPEKYAEWYKNIDGRDYSAATDELQQRQEMDGYIYNSDGTVVKKDSSGNVIKKYDNMNAFAKEHTINANTPMISITIEDDKDNERQLSETANNEFKGFNLGLIKTIIIPERPIEKVQTDVKINNQVGTTIVSESLSNRQSNYTTALGAIVNGGTKIAKGELPPDNIFGSNMELTYKITATNTSEAYDYVEDATDENFGDYFKYGKITESAHKKTITPLVVEDDLDKKFNIDSLPKETTQTTSFRTSTEPQKITLNPVTTEETDPVTGTTTTKTYIEMKGWESLAKGESTTTSYTVTGLVSNNELGDTSFDNIANIKALGVDNLTTLASETKVWEADNTVFTIMPTTGENKNYTYWYIGAVAIAIIASGIILIKKKVL